MKKYVSVLLLAGSLGLASAQNYTFTLTPGADGGGARQGSGSGVVTLSGNTIHISGSFTGLSGTWSADHFHGPAAPGVNAGVLYGLQPLTTLNPGNTSGTINGDVTLIDNPGGTTFTIAQQMDQINNGLWYVNVHSSTFGGGEIRGQVLPVPEPSTFGLIALGLGGAWWLARLRRR